MLYVGTLSRTSYGHKAIDMVVYSGMCKALGGGGGGGGYGL